MIGAVYTEAFRGTPAMALTPAVLLVLLALVAYRRRPGHQTSGTRTSWKSRMGRFANIGAREIRLRRLMGLASAGAAALLGFVLIGYEAPRWWRLIIFLPLWMAGLGLLQAREKTWLALAARGTCNLDYGEQAVTNADEREGLKRQARSIHRRALTIAVVLTAVALLLE
jgi:hypothetical protein